MTEENLMATLYVVIMIVAAVLTVACIRRWIPEFRDGWENYIDRRNWIALQQLSKAHVLWIAAIAVASAAAWGIQYAFDNETATSAAVCIPVGIIVGFKIETVLQVWRIKFFNQREENDE